MPHSTSVFPPRMRNLFAVAIVALSIASTARATTYNLTASSPTTNWSDVTKWNGGTGSSYPGQGVGDTAIIPLSGFTLNIDVAVANPVVLQVSGSSVAITIPAGSSLNITTGSSSIASDSVAINGGQFGVSSGSITWNGGLALNTGTLALTGNLSNVSGGGPFAINGGFVNGAGTLIVASGTTLAITGSGGGMNVDGAVLDILGNASYTSSSGQSLSLLNGANVKIESGGQFNATGVDPIGTNNVGSPAINIQGGGAFTKSTSAGTLQVSAAVNNAGSITVSTGNLNLYGGGTHSGAFSTATGGTIMSFNGAHVLNVGSSAAGGGFFDLAGGTFDVNTAAATPFAPSKFSQSGGTLGGTGTFRVTTTFNWTGGNQSNSGTTELQGTTTINGGSVQIDTGRTVANSGTINYAPTSGFLTIDGAAHIDNSGTIDLQNDALINSSSPSNSYILTNGNGFLKKSAGSSTNIACSVRLNGQGTLQPAANMNISLGGGTGTGNFGGATAVIDLTAAGSEVYLAGGTFVFAGAPGSLAVNGSGELRLANAVLQLTSGPLTVSNFVFDGAAGLLQASGPGIVVNGSGGVFSWSGGTIDGLSSGADIVTVNGPTGTLDIVGGIGPMIMQSAAHVKNAGGAINFNPSTNLSVNSGSVLDNNSGTFTFNNNNTTAITTDNFSNPVFTNSGTVTKAANPNVQQVDVKFTSTTTVTVNGGTLKFMGGGANSGAMTATNAADRIEIGGGFFQMNGGATVGGSGTLAVNAGAIMLNNTATSVTNFELAGGVTGAGSLAVNNAMKWLSGGFTGSGSATIAAGKVVDATALTGSPTIADGFTFTNNGVFNYNPTFSLTFNNSGSGGATFTNNAGATFDIQGNGTTIAIGAGHLFNNSGTVKKTAGAGGFTFTVPFSNGGSGIVDEQFASNSTIAFSGGGTQSGGSIKASNAAGNIDFTGGAMVVTGGAFAGPGAINLKGATLTVNAPQTFPPIFNMSTAGSQINGNQSIDIPSGAVFNWSGGTITASGAFPFTVLSGGIMNADTTAVSLIFDTRPLFVSSGGNFNWNAGSNSLIFQNGAAVGDLGAFTVTTNGTLGNNTGGAFNVGGTFTHNAAGTLNVALAVSTVTGGVVTSQGGGVLNLSNGGTHTGGLDAQTGSFIDFGGGTHTLNAGASFSAGTGVYKLVTGTLDLQTNMAAPNFAQIGGILSGTGNLNTSSALSWSGGTMGGTGTTTVAGGSASLTTGPLTLNRPLTLNAGTSMNAAGGLQDNSTLTNNTTFDLQNGNITGSGTIANSGTIQKTINSVSNISVPITGSGALTVNAGTIGVQASANFTGVTVNGATAQFSGPVVAVGTTSGNGNLVVSGGGTTVSGTSNASFLQVTGGTLTLDGTSTALSLSVSGGTLTGTGAITTSGLAFTGGTISGAGTLTVTNNCNVSGTSGPMLLSRPATLAATVSSGSYGATPNLLTLNSTLTVNGLWLTNSDILGTGAIAINGALQVNNGTYAVSFSNAGSVLFFGPATLNGGYTQTAGTTTTQAPLTPASPIQILGGTLTLVNSNGINGSLVNNGMLTMVLPPFGGTGNFITGNYTQGASGILKVDINGTSAGQTYTQLKVTGNATLNGTLNATLGYSPANGDFYDVLTVGGTRTSDFATKNLPSVPAGSLSAAYIPGTPEALRITATVSSADLSLAVAAPSTVLHGQNATLTYTVTNLGATAASSVVFNDTLTNASLVSITGPACTSSPITCNIGTLAAGGTATIVLQINATTLGSISSNANVTQSVVDPTPANNSALSTITVTPASDFGVLSVNAPATVNAGANFTDTVTVKNGGPDSGTPNLNLSITGGSIVSVTGGGFVCTFTASSAACTGPSLAVNGTAALSVGITSQLSPGTVTLTATTSSSADPSPGNNTGSGSSSIGNVADVSVVKTGPPTANVGDTVSYTIKVTNNGPADATSVAVNDPTPARLTFSSISGASCASFPCALGTLTTGQSLTFTAAYTVTAGPPVTITNLATATTATLDPNPGNDTGSTVTAVGCSGGGPTPITPAANSVIGSPATFTWSAVPGAIDYTVTVNASGTQITLGPTASTTITGAVPDGIGFWNVSANFGGQCTNVPSVNVPITICSGNATPLLRLISEAVSGQTYRAEWDAVPGATKYELDESATADFATLTTTSTTSTSVQFQKTVSTPTPFFYRVRAFLACAGKFGPTTDPLRIVIVPPPAKNDPNPNVNVPAGSTQSVTQIVHVPGLPNGSFSFTATGDEPWFTVSPLAGLMPPGGFDFTVTFNPALVPGTNGTFSGTILVTLQTGTSLAGNVGTRDNTTTTVKAPVSISLVTPVSSTPKGTPPQNALIIPSVGHLTGLNSVWRSDIRLANVGAGKTKYQLTFTPTGDDASKPVKQTIVEVEAGGTMALDDVVRNWYGVGSLGEGANGVLEIHPATNIDVTTTTAVVSSRTYNVSASGTLGQFIPAIPFASFISKAAAGQFAAVLGLQQIAQSADFRTNLGLVEAAGKPATVAVTVFDGLGNNVFSQTITLAAGEQKQLNSFLEQNHISLVDGRIEVQVIGGDGRVTAYASRVDNKSGDPLLVSGVPLRAATSAKYVLPGVATINSGFANWQSDVRIFNAGSTPATPTVTYYPQNGNGSPSATSITINPGETKQLDNILQALFGLADTGGALHVTTPNATNLVVSGRTYNQTSNGTFGQFIPAVTPTEAVGTSGRALQILQAEESVRYRTNLGIAEVTGKPALVEISVFVPDSKIAPKTTFTIGANEFRQFNVIHEIGLDNVYNARIQVRVLSGDGKVTAYGSVIDMLTQDGTYVPAQ